MLYRDDGAENTRMEARPTNCSCDNQESDGIAAEFRDEIWLRVLRSTQRSAHLAGSRAGKR